MKTIKAVLTAEGKAGTQWSRRDGVRPSATCTGTFDVHLSIEGATRIEAQRDVPPVVAELLAAGAIRWDPGVRLQRTNPRWQHPSTVPVAVPARAPGSFRFAELFAGIGGFRLGLESLGGECVFASEIDPLACSTYQGNFGAAPEAGDITEVEGKDVPAHDLLVGGFPCQCFSMAGEQKGLSDDGRGHLYLEVCRLLCAAQPKAFLLENVAALYTLDEGVFHKDYEKRQPGKVHAHIIADLEACGYKVTSRILGAHAFGVPQYRDRLYFVGFRADTQAIERFEWPRGLIPMEWNHFGDAEQVAAHQAAEAAAEAAAAEVVAAAAQEAAPAADAAAAVGNEEPGAGAGSSYTRSRTGRCLKRAPEGCAPLRTVLEPDDTVAVRAARLSTQQYAKIRHRIEEGASAARVEGLARTLLASYRTGWHRYSELLRMRDGQTLRTEEDAAGAAKSDGAHGTNGAADGGGGCDGARFFTAREAARLMGFPESFVIPGHPQGNGKDFEMHFRFYHQIGNAVCPPVINAVAAPMLTALGLRQST